MSALHPHLKGMTRAFAIVGLLLAASLAHAQDGGTISIMKPEPGARPEPWLAPKYQTPRSERVAPPPSQAVPPKLTRQRTPPDLYVPQTGRVVPNLPTTGVETSQDRAMRCAHQSGMAGAAGGDRNAYLGTCINQ